MSDISQRTLLLDADSKQKIGIYAPRDCKSEKDKDFYDNLQTVAREVKKKYTNNNFEKSQKVGQKMEVENSENENNMEIGWRKLKKNSMDAAHEALGKKTLNINWK